MYVFNGFTLLEKAKIFWFIVVSLGPSTVLGYILYKYILNA